ncbi:MAG: hypothetical protein E7437_07590 [Ruminococcaceae bacterium]|nr:hypothetical protein [Oscillospiraceae bacterium]
MDHSVEAYLRQLSSRELELFLWHCTWKSQWTSYAYVIPQIIDILKERGKCIPELILDSWEAFLQSHP